MYQAFALLSGKSLGMKLDPVVVALQFILQMLVFLLKVLHPWQIMTKIVASHQQPLLPVVRVVCTVHVRKWEGLSMVGGAHLIQASSSSTSR